MYQIDDQAAAVPPAVPPAGVEGWFTSGDPVTRRPYTRLRAWWLNMVQAELGAIVAAAGLARDKANNSQVLQALRAMFVDHPTLDAEVVARTTADSQEAAARAAADTTEANARAAADAAEVSARQAADTAEANARTAADTAEAAARASADNAEANARATADALLAPYAAFASIPSSLGSQNLPAPIGGAGLRFIWGSGATATGNQDVINFPSGGFPTACLGMVICEAAAVGWSAGGGPPNPTMLGYTPVSRLQFAVSSAINNPSPAYAPDVSYTYFAWGY